jgi:hypothetical protein
LLELSEGGERQLLEATAESPYAHLRGGCRTVLASANPLTLKGEHPMRSCDGPMILMKR